jgi:hypothetical protein
MVGIFNLEIIAGLKRVDNSFDSIRIVDSFFLSISERQETRSILVENNEVM